MQLHEVSLGRTHSHGDAFRLLLLVPDYIIGFYGITVFI